MSSLPDDPASSHGAGRHLRSMQTESFFVSETLHSAGSRTDAHSHDYGCIHFVLSGSYVESSSSRTCELLPGGVLMKPPELRHWNSFSREARSLRVEFPWRVIERVSRWDPDDLVHLGGIELERLAAHLRSELREPDDCSSLAVEGLCQELLAISARQLHRLTPRERGMPECVAACVAHLREHFRSPVRFGALAPQLGVNRTRLASVFRRHLGCTMGDYLRSLRVEHVKRQLQGSARPLAEIAHEAGFCDQSHCSRVFRALVGVPPSRWRAGDRG